MYDIPGNKPSKFMEQKTEIFCNKFYGLNFIIPIAEGHLHTYSILKMSRFFLGFLHILLLDLIIDHLKSDV